MYKTAGILGIMNYALLIGGMIQGIVLFGVAQEVTRWLAFRFFKEDGTSYIVKNYAETEASSP